MAERKGQGILDWFGGWTTMEGNSAAPDSSRSGGRSVALRRTLDEAIPPLKLPWKRSPSRLNQGPGPLRIDGFDTFDFLSLSFCLERNVPKNGTSLTSSLRFPHRNWRITMSIPSSTNSGVGCFRIWSVLTIELSFLYTKDSHSWNWTVKRVQKIKKIDFNEERYFIFFTFFRSRTR